MTSVQETSLEAYFRKVLPKLGHRQNQVLTIFQQSPSSLTNMEAARALDWSINRVTPRVLELRNLGLLMFHQTRRCHVTGNMAMTWRTPARGESAR